MATLGNTKGHSFVPSGPSRDTNLMKPIERLTKISIYNNSRGVIDA